MPPPRSQNLKTDIAESLTLSPIAVSPSRVMTMSRARGARPASDALAADRPFEPIAAPGSTPAPNGSTPPGNAVARNGSAPGEPIAERTAPVTRLQALLDEWTARLRLADQWQVQGKVVPAMYQQTAQVKYNSYGWHAIVEVGENVPAGDWPWDVVHELLHLVHNPLRQFIDRLMGQIDPRLLPLFDELRRDAEEPVINLLTEILIGARSPMPPEIPVGP